MQLATINKNRFLGPTALRHKISHALLNINMLLLYRFIKNFSITNKV